MPEGHASQDERAFPDFSKEIFAQFDPWHANIYRLFVENIYSCLIL